MSRDELWWERVNAALDERRDPLEDAAVEAAIVERPERLAEVLALRERLALVTSGEQLTAPRSRRLRRVAALVAGCAAVAVAWLTLARVERSTPPAVAAPPAIDGSRVLSLCASEVRERADQRTTITFDGRRVVERTESLPSPLVLAHGEPPRFVALAESTAFTR